MAIKVDGNATTNTSWPTDQVKYPLEPVNFWYTDKDGNLKRYGDKDDGDDTTEGTKATDRIK